MSKANKDTTIDAYVGLPEALRIIADKYPWAPIATLRNRVRLGEIPSKRSSPKKRAKHYVLLTDLEKAVIGQ
jgi:hypothetical protein